MPLSASHNVAAEATNVASTVSSSNSDRLMTFSTLAVAACCRRASISSPLNRSFFPALIFAGASLRFADALPRM